MKKINCILLVDDNTADNVYHKIIITEADVCNYIQMVTSGREALDYLIKAAEPNQSESFPKPNIIYLDINMPRMNGFEFLEHYQKLDVKFKSEIKIIVLSTSMNPDDQKKSIAIKEVSEFQNKPLTVEMVHATIEKYFPVAEVKN